MSEISKKEKIFEIKKNFLGPIPHPKLIDKAIKSLSLDEIYDRNIEEDIPEEELLDFLNSYLTKILELKLKISKSNLSEELASLLLTLKYIQFVFFEKLKRYLPRDIQYGSEKLKISESIDAYDIIKELNKNGLEENEISEYICKQIESKEYSYFVISCLRAQKILANER